MTGPMPARLQRFAIVLGLLGPVSGPACAEGNRLLPFWGQPFPAGYAATRAEVDIRDFAPCRSAAIGRRIRHGHHSRTRCEAVLHARD